MVSKDHDHEPFHIWLEPHQAMRVLFSPNVTEIRFVTAITHAASGIRFGALPAFRASV